MSDIATLANRHNVTHRALRFYEGKGLLSPKRDGRERIYSDKDEARLKLILEAKALGFSLSEIRALIRMRPDGVEQLVITPEVAKAQLVVLRDRHRETGDAILELAERLGRRGIRTEHDSSVIASADQRTPVSLEPNLTS